jgi:hypothetical protein
VIRRCLNPIAVLVLRTIAEGNPSCLRHPTNPRSGNSSLFTTIPRLIRCIYRPRPIRASLAHSLIQQDLPRLTICMAKSTKSNDGMKSEAAIMSASAGTKRKRSQPKFYAVRVGRTRGIYHTWDDCKAQTHGFKDAKCKTSSNYVKP